MARYLCIDFETNGFSDSKGEFSRENWTLPFSSFPTQVSVDVVEGGVVEHVYDTVICGATGLSKWAKTNVNLTLEEIAKGKPFGNVVKDLAALMDDNTVVVAHNANFDLGMALKRTAAKLGIDDKSIDKILKLPAKQRLCTMRCAYSKAVFGKQLPKLIDLCAHFGVELRDAHDARADSFALAQCVAVAWRRGVMLD